MPCISTRISSRRHSHPFVSALPPSPCLPPSRNRPLHQKIPTLLSANPIPTNQKKSDFRRLPGHPERSRPIGLGELVCEVEPSLPFSIPCQSAELARSPLSPKVFAWFRALPAEPPLAAILPRCVRPGFARQQPFFPTCFLAALLSDALSRSVSYDVFTARGFPLPLTLGTLWTKRIFDMPEYRQGRDKLRHELGDKPMRKPQKAKRKENCMNRGVVSVERYLPNCDGS
jgi:hypothetical protein